jgi:hypothetical protein
MSEMKIKEKIDYKLFHLRLDKKTGNTGNLFIKNESPCWEQQQNLKQKCC